MVLNKKRILFGVITGFALITAVLKLFLPHFQTSTASSETFTYFPEDKHVIFEEYSTEVQLLELKDENEYILDWDSHSKTNKKVFLLQNISLLFENGILVGYQTVQNQNTDHIKGNAIFHGEDSGKHEAISFHYAEVHYPNDMIKGKQAMSADTLYIIDSPLSPITTFKEAKTPFEQRSKELLESIINQQLSYIWEGLMEEYQIDQEQYYTIPLNELITFSKEPFPSFSVEETTMVIGKLWEGLHRYYISGINTFTDNSYDPVGNTIPLVLLHKDGNHLIVLYRTADNTGQQLFQLIP